MRRSIPLSYLHAEYEASSSAHFTIETENRGQTISLAGSKGNNSSPTTPPLIKQHICLDDLHSKQSLLGQEYTHKQSC